MKSIAMMLIAGTAATATAGTFSETYSGDFELTTTNWNETFDVVGFDSQNGTRVLKSVEITLNGDVVGNAQAESLDMGATLIELSLQATLTLSLTAAGTELAEVIPVVNESFNASAFDGAIDFGGTSGVSFLELSGSASESESINTQSVLDEFIDVASVSLDADATGSSFGSGAGNLITQFATEAGLDWEITYVYNVIPAPGALALLGLGGLVAGRRRG